VYNPMPTNIKPSTFIGSSTEGLDVARALQVQLDSDAEITVWKDSFFQPRRGYLETLVDALDRFDFALLVLSPDDFISSRGDTKEAPRDNVMFELGLFMGRLGRSRTFVIRNAQSNLKMPSDLAGVTHLTYDGERTDKNLTAAVASACTTIRNTMRSLGVSPTRTAQALQQATSQVENVSEQVGQIVRLLARSRVVELEITAKMFGGMIPSPELDKIRRDLNDLEKSLSTKT